MTTIDKAFCNYETVKSILKFSDITEHENFETIKHFLKCPTSFCTARLTYARGESAHLRTFKGDKHSEDCEYSFVRIERDKQLKREGEIAAKLTEKDFMKKHKYLMDKFLNISTETSSTTSPKEKKSKIKSSDESTEPYVVATLSSSAADGESIAELKKSGKRVMGPRIPSKSINQIGNEDLNTKCETLAQINKIIKIRDKFYEVHGNWKDFTVTFILPESFFANQYVEMENYIQLLSKFLTKNTKYDVFLCTCCEVTEVETKKVQLSIFNHDWPALIISKDANRPTSFTQFVAHYTRGHYD